MKDAVSLAFHDDIAVIVIDNPPVNALSHAVRAGLSAALDAIAASDARIAILAAAGSTFPAGADISELGKPMQEPALPDVIAKIEACKVPVIAALFGSVLGGGLELALGCRWRAAHAATMLGLPEVNLGIIPGAGGTQRLPRLTGAEKALEMIVTGKPVTAAAALSLGLADAVTEEDILSFAMAFAREQREKDAPPPISARAVPCFDPDCFHDWRQRAQKTRRGEIAPLAAIDAVERAAASSFPEGMAFERAQSLELRAGPQSAALRHLFFAERAAVRVPDAGPALARPIHSVAVAGGGTMGSGIVIAHLEKGFGVTLLETSAEALEAALGRIRNHFAEQVEKGRLDRARADAAFARLSGTLVYEDLKDADLVIEAVFENMDVKRELFGKLDAVCKPSALFATNTSYLDVNEIARASNRPRSTVGLHFFSPANIMKLLEVVRGAETDAAVIATALKHGKALGKVPVVSGVCFGFIGNRMLQHYQREVGLMLLEGAAPSEIDNALLGFGMAMGPFAVADLSGIDIGYAMRRQAPASFYEPKAFLVHDALVEMGRKGRKTGAGFYRYGNGKAAGDDPDVLALIEDIAKAQEVARRKIGEAEIVERAMLALANEGARIVGEGIAQRAPDVDVVYTNGYGFPRYRGGPLHYAESLGLAHVLDRIRHYGEIFGPRWWTPAPLIERLARENKRF